VTPFSQIFAPGSRVVVRDAEWVVRRVDTASDGGYLLTCDGISELVRDRTARFLTQLERGVQVLDPAETELVADGSQQYQASILYMESLLRQATPNDARVHVAHKAAMDLVSYQIEPAVQALKQPRQRILIADAVGLGKTLEAGILVCELIHRGRGKRILVLTLKSMLTQFQKEFWNRFTIALTRLDSIGLQRVRNRIPTNHNPFYYYDKAIISIDTLKQDTEYRVYLEQAYWDIIVIDEAHNVADRGTSSQRARLAKLLAGRSDTLIMLSATPHDGRARSFASLMNMLDPTAISDPEHYAREDFTNKGLVVRRFKKDIQHQVDSEFKEREVYRLCHQASPEEEATYEALLEVRFTRAGRHDGQGQGTLLRITLQKALFSSPAACRDSVANRIAQLSRQQEAQPTDAIQTEIEDLRRLDAQLARIEPGRYAKYQALLDLIRRQDFDWSARRRDDRLVIFSERIETLHFLKRQLSEDLRLRPKQVELLHGQMSDVDQQAIVEAFGRPEAPVRVLLCSDVASEGINLHYLSHRLIHFDIPWSLMVFQQRNGRIDRYGQERTPRIYYLITEAANPTVRGDLRILEVLQEKDDQAYKNIGDPSAFMNVYDIVAEEKITEAAMIEGKSAECFDTELVPKKDEGEALLELFLGETAEPPTAAQTPEAPPISEPLSLFPDDYSFASKALAQLNAERKQVAYNTEDQGYRITLVAPEDLRHRFSYLPREVYPDAGQFVLTDDKEVIKQEIARSREDESAWPKIHYLWSLHPVMQWLNDRMLSAFGRHKAPVMELIQGLEPGETLFVISGLVPNRKAHPLVYEWIGVSFQHGVFQSVEPFAKVVVRTALGSRPIPNRGREPDLEGIKRLLPEAVSRAREWVIERRNRFERQINEKLNDQLKELERLRERQLDQLARELERSSQAEAFKKGRRQQRTRVIEDIFDEYMQWVEDTMTTEKKPYLQVVSVLTRPNGVE
jgi:superfamily II DNA or RNA helicase